MPDTDLTTFRVMTIDICDQSFPKEWTNENRKICRDYVSQVMGPLLSVEVIRTEKSASVMYRVGRFLREDGKIRDSERILLQAVEINTEILGDDHHDTLMTMDDLAMAYLGQGKTAEAGVTQEQVLEKSKRILGDDHPSTLNSMHNLAATYRAQGKTAEAAVLEEQVLEESKRILGDHHPSTLATMNNLAPDRKFLLTSLNPASIALFTIEATSR